ncbi:MAG: XdhC family protein [Armatimonadota bacterium]|nr:XdhC family protein [Armatimonadota bacterium]MDR7452936.1 XdhC family protein [Armatimonadota bacterium]MDR7456336.1 XdhC family protein [Armatimonadota bacterium]MDR7496993.1 XdhC family protein [Armatimonadota bacterium]MDR7510753.1 XdhC family protein [Armatimonadota bacterium]
MTDDLLALAHELARRGEPFATATVVRAVRPTSAKPGARALVRMDGSLHGWVGGSCAEPAVVREALGALRDGRPRLIALVGEGSPARAGEGMVEYAMSCHSGGTLEIYIEPVLSAPRVILIGHGPVIATLARLADAVAFAVTVAAPEDAARELDALHVGARTSVVVATHGAADEDALDHALRSDAGYVSLVASRRRAAAVVAVLRERGVSEERLRRLHAPAGLDIGAVTPQEIAASILAEMVQVFRAGVGESPAAAASPGRVGLTEATDPVCGMVVEVATARFRSEADGRVFYFCCAGCKRAFDEEPARYTGSAAR